MECLIHAPETSSHAHHTGNSVPLEATDFHRTLRKCMRASQTADWHLNCVTSLAVLQLTLQLQTNPISPPIGMDSCPTMTTPFRSRPTLPVLLFTAFMLPAFSFQHAAGAEQTTRHCQAEVCCCSKSYALGGWQVIESANFRVFHIGQGNVANKLVVDCEQQRWTLQKRWLNSAQQAVWTPKCDVYCYPSGKEYARLTKYPAESWGHVDLEIGEGRVWRRRLNLRTDLDGRFTTVAAHELTHVVLADAFCTKQIPRWADEGIAVQSEPSGRRDVLRQKLSESLTQGRRFSLQELTSAASYPNDPVLTELFYAQSGAWIEFLTVKKKVSGAQLLKIVAGIPERGLHSTLREHLNGISVSEIEADWKDWLTQPELLAENK